MQLTTLHALNWQFSRWLRYLALVLCCCMGYTDMQAQTNMKWARSDKGTSVDYPMGTDETDITYGVTVDTSGNTYALGSSNDDSEPLDPNAQDPDIDNTFFLNKYDPDGNLLWQIPIDVDFGSWSPGSSVPDFWCLLKGIGCPTNVERPYAQPTFMKPIVADSLGVFVCINIYPGSPKVSGMALRFGENGSPLGVQVTKTTNLHAFILKYTFDGELVETSPGVDWIKYLDASNSSSFLEVRAIELGNDEDLFISGTFDGQVDMETDVNNVGNMGQITVYTENGSGLPVQVGPTQELQSAYVARYDNVNGLWRWTTFLSTYHNRAIRSVSNPYAGFCATPSVTAQPAARLQVEGLSADDNNIYMAGTLRGSIAAISYTDASNVQGDTFTYTPTDPAFNIVHGYNKPAPLPWYTYYVTDSAMYTPDDFTADTTARLPILSKHVRFGDSTLMTMFPMRSSYYEETQPVSVSFDFGTFACTQTDAVWRYHTTDAVLFQIGQDGELVWGKQWDQSPAYAAFYQGRYSNERGGPVLTDDGNLFMTMYGGQVDMRFETAPNVTDVYGSSFVGKLFTSVDNTVHWIHPIYSAYPYDLVATEDHELIIGGEVVGSGGLYNEPFDGTSSPYQQFGVISSVGANDILMMQMDQLGTRRWETSVGGPGYEAIYDMDTYGDDFIIGGFYQDVVDFQPSPTLNYLLTAESEEDAFVARYGCYEIELLADQDTVCEGTLVSFTVNTTCPTGNCDYIYEWTTASGTVTSTSPSFSYLGTLGTNIISVVATDQLSNCQAEASIDIQVNPVLTVTTNPSSILLCDGSPAVFAVTTSNPTATFAWYYQNTSSPVLGTSTTFTATTAGAYIVVASAEGCSEQSTVIFNQYSVVTPVMAPDVASICAGGDASLYVGACPGCSYSWTVPIGSLASSTSNLLYADLPGYYEVDIVDANGCAYTLGKTVGISPSLTPSIIAANAYNDTVSTVCNGDPVILETAFCPTCVYQWSDGSTAPFTAAFGAGNYQVTVVDNATGCSGTSQNVYVDVANISTPTLDQSTVNICGTTFPDVAVTNSCAFCTYEWYNNTTGLIVGTGDIFSVPAIGDYYVEATDTSNSCTAISGIVSAGNSVASVPIVTGTNQYDPTTSVVCSGAFVTLSTLSCVGCTYQWMRNDTIIIGATNSTYTTNQTSNNYKVEVTYANGCAQASSPYRISTHAPFVPQVFAADPSHGTICNGAPVTLSINNVTIAFPPSWSYQWYFNSAIIPGETGMNYDAFVPGIYHATIIDDLGCYAVADSIEIGYSNTGAGPLAVASPSFVCQSLSGYTSSTVSVGACAGCQYQWYDINNSPVPAILGGDTSELVVSGASIGYVELTSPEGCVYTSNLIEVLDSVLATPTITASGTTTCSNGPVVLTAPICAGCSYIWYQDNVQIQAGQQNTYTASIAGDYEVTLISFDSCVANSNVKRVTFSTINAQLQTPSTTTICNGAEIVLQAIPDGASCVGCTYEWYRNNSQLATANVDTFPVTAAGDYHVIVTNPEGCPDTSTAITFSNVALSTAVSSTSDGICGSNYPVELSVPACSGCTYQWHLNNFAIVGANANTYNLVGYAAQGMYMVEVNRNNCIAQDSIQMDSLAPLTFTVTVDPSHGSICNGDPILMTSSCAICTHQWFVDGDSVPAPLGTVASFLTDSTGNYHVVAADTSGCVATSPVYTLTEVDPPFDFALNFDTMSTLPISYGPLNMALYLHPVSIRPGSPTIDSSDFFSFTANNAILGSVIDPALAGPGIHIIQYTYYQDNCEFSVVDTIQILDPMSINVANFSTMAPAYEACVGDTMTIYFNNFTFNPDTILLSTGGANTIAIPINPVPPLVLSGGVWNGSVKIIIPAEAKTGKLTATDGTTSFQTDFFVVIQNPEATISLNGVPEPLCSNSGLITLLGTPANGLFKAAYYVDTAAYVPSLISGADLVTGNVTNYDLDGHQTLQLSYWYAPEYSNTNFVCSDTLVAHLNVEVRDVNLTNVEYTPISVTQDEEAMELLTRVVWPLSTRFYGNHYIGTYVSNDTILPSTITMPAWLDQEITYQVVNDGCTETNLDTMDIWTAPDMNPIPKYICREDTIIYIGRNALGIYYTVGGIQSAVQNPLYVYQFNNVSSGVDFAYIEQINLMQITSSAGGLTPINLANGSELYALDPAAIAGSSTELTITFSYNRDHFYFTPSNSNYTVTYTIAEISKLITIEEPVTAQISPSIVSDPIFCQENNTMQLSGLPVGGDYYLDGNPLQNNIFNPSLYLPGTHDLKYVYEGLACKDSTEIDIYIPTPFTISVVAPTGVDYCVNDENDTITFSVTGISPGAIDSTSGQFFVGGIQAGSIFAPSQKQPGTYPVMYAISDTFGCEESATSTFFVHDIPSLSMTVLDTTAYCLNHGNIPVELYHGSTLISSSVNPNILYPTGGVAVLDAVGIIGGTAQIDTMNAGYSNFLYEPTLHGVGIDTMVYTYTDTNLCTHSIWQQITIEALPVLSMATTNGAPIGAQYCEGSIVPLYGFPSGNDGAFDSVSTTNNTPVTEYNLNAVTNIFVAHITDNGTASAIETFQYSYTDPATGCKDTIFEDIEVLNYTVAIDIQGLAPTMCAYDVDVPIVANQTIFVGAGISGGTFTSTDPNGLLQTSGFDATFYPDTLGIVDEGEQVIITFDYMDGLCPNQVKDTVYVHPLPQLTYDLPGNRLLNSISTQQHICIDFAPEPIRVYNLYEGVTSNVTTAGTYLTGQGVVIPNGSNYSPALGGPGMDVITFTYTDVNGCINTIIDSIAVDTVPPLTLIGYPATVIGTGTALDPYTYCANDLGHLVIPSPFGGQMYANGAIVSGNVFDLQPSQLAASGYADTTHRLSYVYIAARYTDGRVCVDSTADTILIHPTPVLQMAVGIPTEYCVGTDPVQTIPLSASPVGGVFEDITDATIVNGIVQDTLFNALAQLGDRVILYWYEDPVTGCRDSIEHGISVHRTPHVGFFTGGGCVGTTVQFNADSTLLDNDFPARDSLTSIVWTFEPGVVVPVTNAIDPLQVPTINHNYAAAGIYFPVLTLTNRGHCTASHTERVVISPRAAATAALPYIESFDETPGGWIQEQGDVIGVPVDTTWQWGMAAGQRINTVFFEDIVWVTRKNAPYKKNENAWVYSPCIDISELERPMISLNIWRDSRQGVDGAVLEYFDDLTQTWQALGYRDKGIKWYNPQFVIASPGDQASEPIGWSGTSNGWENPRYRLDGVGHDLRGRTDVRFRMAFQSSPNTVVNGLEGFAFDDVYIGNRQRNVLVEHFTNQYHPGIENLEPNLYSTIYSTLYGRDVSLIQYHTRYDNPEEDEVFLYNTDESNARTTYYSVTASDQVRLDGKDLVSTTTELIFNQQDLLDEEMLQDPKFDINFLTPPQFVFNGSTMHVHAEVVAREAMPFDDYVVHVVMTEDSVENEDEDYPMMAVMRDMLPSPANAGADYEQDWEAGDAVEVEYSQTIDVSAIDPTQAELVIFIQRVGTKEIYQVATTRNLTIYEGPLYPIGVEPVEGAEIADMVLYPNPAENYFHVEFSTPLLQDNDWRLVDMAGRLLQEGTIGAGSQFLKVYTEQLAGGMYIFSVRNDNVYTQRKVIISR